MMKKLMIGTITIMWIKRWASEVSRNKVGLLLGTTPQGLQ